MVLCAAPCEPKALPRAFPRPTFPRAAHDVLLGASFFPLSDSSTHRTAEVGRYLKRSSSSKTLRSFLLFCSQMEKPLQKASSQARLSVWHTNAVSFLTACCSSLGQAAAFFAPDPFRCCPQPRQPQHPPGHILV